MSGTVYDGISRHMTVYAFSVKVHTSIYQYILVHAGTSEYILVLMFCSLLHPAGPPESCGPASAKRHPFQAATSLFFHAFLWLLRAVAKPAVAGGDAGAAAASPPPPPPSCGLGRGSRWRRCRRREIAIESRARAPSILRMLLVVDRCSDGSVTVEDVLW